MVKPTGNAGGVSDWIVETDKGVRLRGAECEQCGNKVFPYEAICGECWSETIKPILLGPEGTLYTYTVVHQGRPGWPTPYVLGFIDLAEGVRVSAPIETTNAKDIVIGVSVELTTKVLRHEGDKPVLSHCFKINAGAKP